MANKTSPKEISLGINRRRFIYYSAIAASAAAIGCKTSESAGPTRINYKSPNEKLNVGGIGVGGKGASDIEGPFNAGENIVAICDVDENTLNKSGQKYTGARKYRDYRRMLEEQKDLDAVVISTPDHQHAPAAMRAIKLGKHVYVQKPLTHTIWEARALTEAAREYKVATQMGNQGHCGVGVRELCEMIWSDAIGEIKEVHCWSDRPIWPQGLNRPSGSDPVPATLDWDVWLGPAPMRPFKASWPDEMNVKSKRGGVYHPFSWRGWWEFGCGALGDMGCHIMDPANWALHLGSPLSVETVENDSSTKEMAPVASVVRYEFPKRKTEHGSMPALTLYWHDGGKQPAKPAEMEAKEIEKNGTIFIGSKGKLVCDAYGGNPRLLPESKMKDYVKPAQSIPRIPENDPYKDWIRACKGGPAACSNFDYSGPFTEVVLLGNLTLRLGKKIEWDAKNMRAKNAPEADEMIRKTYRAGWEV